LERLYRSRRQRVLGGVAGGLAEYFGVDVVLVRLLWVMTLFFGGAGFLAYIVAWIIIPDEQKINFSSRGVSNTPPARPVCPQVESPEAKKEEVNADDNLYKEFDDQVADQGESAFNEAAQDTEEHAERATTADGDSFDVYGQDGQRFKVDNRQRYAGLILIGLGVFFFLREIMPWSIFRYIWPLVLIIIGIYFLIRGQREEG
jgi:phage shock protein C